ncbi:MAG: SDR family oxidoreductase [Bdellovibrionales bacterium]|nr:SDR family oxidoreductase [Bdellovibrionales bacterium]
MKFQNKNVFISGANRGIGKALVIAALEAGANKVYAAARNTSEIKKLENPKIIPVTLDITNSDSVTAAARLAADTDILINNAGVLAFGSVLQGKVSELERDFETNFFGTLKMIRAFAPNLVEKKDGSIANLLSIVALASMSGLAGYSASKAALMSATQALRAELRNSGVSIHGIFPGPIDTEMAKGIELPKTSPKETADNIVMGIQSGTEDIFPDQMSIQVGRHWMKDPKGLEKQFASM